MIIIQSVSVSITIDGITNAISFSDLSIHTYTTGILYYVCDHMSRLQWGYILLIMGILRGSYVYFKFNLVILPDEL